MDQNLRNWRCRVSIGNLDIYLYIYKKKTFRSIIFLILLVSYLPLRNQSRLNINRSSGQDRKIARLHLCTSDVSQTPRCKVLIPLIVFGPNDKEGFFT